MKITRKELKKYNIDTDNKETIITYAKIILVDGNDIVNWSEHTTRKEAEAEGHFTKEEKIFKSIKIIG